MSILPIFKKKKESKKKIFFKKFGPYIIGFFIFLCFIALLSPYIFRPWTRYPDKLKAEIAWRYFVATFDGICREACLASRQSYASIWRPIYLEQPELGEDNIRLALQEGSEELQTALVKIMAADYSNLSLPLILQELMMSSETSNEVKRLILVFFPEAFYDSNWLADIRSRVLNNNLSIAERSYALSLLSPFPEAANLSLLKSILMSQISGDLLEEAFNLFSTWPPGALTWSQDDLEVMKSLVLNSPKGSARWRRIWLLSEEGVMDEKMQISILKELAETNFLDPISRGLAADSLLTRFQIIINTPEPSAQEWQEFYASL